MRQVWTKGVPCVDVECEAISGACCSGDPSQPCTDGVTQAACDCPSCQWVKLGACSELDCPPASIPTVNEWGLTVLAMLLLIGAKISFHRKASVA